ncbi:MAG: copper amine oxidase N-terminal domain-containing protein [Oscillospiraceae bacterium]|nr:copper amine oxidase N-terminal domain-containing protein [Oscillospiraceae bacterium]
MKKGRAFLLGFLMAAVLLGLALPAVATGGTVKWDSVFVGAKIVIDGETLAAKDVNGNPVDAVIYKGTTYVPVRSMAEAFGATVEWDQDSRTVYLETEPQPEPEPEPQPEPAPYNPPAPVIPPEPADTRSPAEISEAAMENFLAKVEAGDYTIECEAGVKATVCSDDLVYYTRDIRHDDVDYDGFAIMTVNGNETFEGYLNEDGLTRITFLQEGKAIDAAADGAAIQDLDSKLINWWIDLSDGNIWDLFYNDVQNPLRLVSNADEVKALVRLYGDIGAMAMPRMQEVYLELDGEDPTSAHIRTSFSEGYPNIGDVDILVTFGGTEADPRAEAWMKDPDRAYPEARTEWGADEINLNAIFLPEYGLTAVPFPDFATYAFTLDVGAILEEDVIRVRDAKATEADMQAYAGKLLEKGFQAVTDEEGNTCYRLLLREAYQCYSSICLEYDEGVTLTAEKYYEFPKYSGLEEINGLVTAAGYAALPEDGKLSGFAGVDRANEMTESWLYFFDFDLGLYVDIQYADRAAAEAYVQSYIASLAGFEPDYEGEDEDYNEAEDYLGAEEAARFAALKDEDIFYRCVTPEGQKTFKYRFNEDGETFSLLFKAEKFVGPEEVKTRLAEAGFPEIGLEAYSTCRDFKLFHKTMYGLDNQLDLSLSLDFETAEEAEAFLDEYITFLRDENDFEIMNPDTINMDKAIAYGKEVDGSLLVFGLNYQPETTLASIAFWVV